MLLKRPKLDDLVRLIAEFAWEHRHLSQTNKVPT